MKCAAATSYTSQRESLQLRILRSRRRKLALEENKSVGGHCTELDLAHRGQPLLQYSERRIRSVALSPLWIARPASSSGKRQVRTIRPVLPRDTQLRRGIIHALGKCSKLGPGMNTNPEDARRLSRRKKSKFRETNLEPIAAYATQLLRNCLNLFRLLLANKLQSDVQRLWPHKPCLGRKPAHTLDKSRDLPSDRFIKVDTNKNSHSIRIPRDVGGRSL